MRAYLFLAASSIGLALALTGCDQSAAQVAPDAARSDAATPACTPEPGALGCVTIAFPEQQTEFTQAEASAGIDFVWELVVPEPIAEVYPRNPDWNCCAAGAGPLLARETISGNAQYYCNCDRGLCDPSGCGESPPIALQPGRASEVFAWPGVNWFGPSDTDEPYGPSFPRGAYRVQVRATGTWRPPESTALVSYEVVGELSFAIIDGCGDRPALEAAMWDCTGGVGEGGLCLEVTVDGAGQPVGWTAIDPVDASVEACLDKAITNDCFLSLAATTERVCIYGV